MEDQYYPRWLSCKKRLCLMIQRHRNRFDHGMRNSLEGNSMAIQLILVYGDNPLDRSTGISDPHKVPARKVPDIVWLS